MNLYVCQVVREMFRNTSLLLTDLHPATKYNVSVRGRPKAGHHWSESTSIIKSTDEDGMSCLLCLTIPYDTSDMPKPSETSARAYQNQRVKQSQNRYTLLKLSTWMNMLGI